MIEGLYFLITGIMLIYAGWKLDNYKKRNREIASDLAVYKFLKETQELYDKICHKINRIAPKVLLIDDSFFIDGDAPLACYHTQENKAGFNIDYLHSVLDGTHNIDEKYTAYFRLKDKISLKEYVVYHELFHCISGLSDGEEFENELEEFIKKETKTKNDER